MFFQTDEKLVSADTDSALDVYMRDGGTTTLVSTGPGSGANGAYEAFFAAASTDGSHVFFYTRAPLVGTDTDNTFDVYDRASGNTTLVSTGSAGGNGPFGAELGGISDDGTKAIFTTAESLVATDTDTVQDVYQRAGGVTTLLSVGPNGGNGVSSSTYDGVSQDGSRVFFRTAESLVSTDTDVGIDVYERTNASTTTIHSIGPGGGNGGQGASFVGISRDGTKVFIETPERLIASPIDRDSQNDVYMSSGGTMTMVSPGGNDTVATNAYFIASSDDGSKVFIRSEEALTAGDTDKYQDIYQFSGGTLTLLSTGPNGGNGTNHAFFGGASADGTHVYFETFESLVAGDTDASTDVYERSSGATELISGGVSGGNGPFDATFRSVSPDGNRVFFRTSESLLTADTDAAADVYSANVPGTVTVLLDSLPNDAQDFSFSALGLDDGFAFGPPNFGPTTFSLDDDSDPLLANQKVFTGVTPGAGYSVTETVPPGWDQTAAVCDNGNSPSALDVSAGQNVTCTFTNQKRGQIVLVLDSVPNDAQDFSFTAGGGLSPASFSLDDDSDGTLSNSIAFTDVAVGAGYSLTPGALPAGWSQVSATCSDGSPLSNISVSAGETVTCTCHEQQAGPHRRGHGGGSQRRAGLQLHHRRGPHTLELHARRRRRPHVRADPEHLQRDPGRRLLDLGDSAQRLGPGRCLL